MIHHSFRSILNQRKKDKAGSVPQAVHEDCDHYFFPIITLEQSDYHKNGSEKKENLLWKNLVQPAVYVDKTYQSLNHCDSQKGHNLTKSGF